MLNNFTDGRGGEQLPLFGHFCCRLAAQPDCFMREVISSTTKDGGHASLQGFTLSLWSDSHLRWTCSPQSTTPVNKVIHNYLLSFNATYNFASLNFILFGKKILLILKIVYYLRITCRGN